MHQKLADAVSRAPTNGPTSEDPTFIELVEKYSESTLESLLATERYLNEMRAVQDDATVYASK